MEMCGRLGNQFFRYAFARWLQLNHSTKKNGRLEKLIFDYSLIDQEARKGEMEGWEDSLRHFCTVPYSRYERTGKIIWNETSLAEKVVLGLHIIGDHVLDKKGSNAKLTWEKKFLPWEQRHGIYKTSVGYDFPMGSGRERARRVLAAGPFECARYSEEIRKHLLKEFTPRYPLLDKNKAFYERICSTNSVCITVRRGNFLQYPLLNVCDVRYFEDAVEEMRRLLKDPVFFVFSDEVDWVREHVKINGQVYYEDGNDPVWEKLRLMYSCKHFIISNSTFSWWAQFLGQYEQKVVIAPSRWHNDIYQPPLFEEGWHLIDIDRSE